MIDLRSDTLTLPDEAMLKTVLTAKLGDDGRLDAEGRGEDATVNRLEDLAAEMTGKEAGLLCASGSMGNQAAVLTWCRPGDVVLINERQHLDRSEKTAFDPRFGQLKKATYRHDATEQPDLASMEEALKNNPVKLLYVENSHNYSGGMCINAAEYLGTTVKELAKYVDSLMFCVSKGLGAPVGSLVCGTKAFIKEAKETRKYLGGAMRQAGIIAAPAIYALEHNVARLKEDRENAQLCASLLKDLKKTRVQPEVQTNIMMVDTAGSGVTPAEFCDHAKAKGLFIRPIIGTWVRLVFYKGITRDDAVKAAEIIRAVDAEL